MEFSARSYLTAGMSLTAATAIALTPLAIPSNDLRVDLPRVTVADVRLAVAPTDIEALVANLQAALGAGSTAVAGASGIPGQALIGTVDNIVRLINLGFGGLIDATGDPNVAASLTILKTLSSDAFAKLAENLRRVNPIITSTTAEVGQLLTTALTGSLQNVLIAAVNVANDPLSFASYAGLFSAGVASGQLIAGNGIRAVQSVGDGVLDFAVIANQEFTFQINNAATRLGDLLAQIGAATGNPIVEAIIGTVRAMAIAPALAFVNAGSAVFETVVTTAKAGLDGILGGAANVINPITPAPASIETASIETSSPRAVTSIPEPTLLTSFGVPPVDELSTEPVPEVITEPVPEVEPTAVEPPIETPSAPTDVAAMQSRPESSAATVSATVSEPVTEQAPSVDDSTTTTTDDSREKATTKAAATPGRQDGTDGGADTDDGTSSPSDTDDD